MSMNSLSSLQLDAFSEVAKAKSFSGAAQKLHITQSALSQRILNLEDELETVLFIRDSSGIKMTAVGEKLLKYCQERGLLEKEFMYDLKGEQEEGLSGVIRIAAFSTFVRSVLLPLLGKFGRHHPRVQFETVTREIRDLPNMLKSGETDFVFGIHEIQKKEVENVRVGTERNVLIHSRQPRVQENVFIDHDELDTTTLDFWKIQRKATPPYKRAFFGEVYTMIQAVQEGFGSAIVPLHLVRANKDIRIAKGYVPLDVPIFLSHYRQTFYTKLQEEFLSFMSQNL